MTIAQSQTEIGREPGDTAIALYQRVGLDLPQVGAFAGPAQPTAAGPEDRWLAGMVTNFSEIGVRESIRSELVPGHEVQRLLDMREKLEKGGIADSEIVMAGVDLDDTRHSRWRCPR